MNEYVLSKFKMVNQKNRASLFIPIHFVHLWKNKTDFMYKQKSCAIVCFSVIRLAQQKRALKTNGEKFTTSCVNTCRSMRDVDIYANWPCKRGLQNKHGSLAYRLLSLNNACIHRLVLFTFLSLSTAVLLLFSSFLPLSLTVNSFLSLSISFSLILTLLFLFVSLSRSVYYVPEHKRCIFK